MKFRAIYLLRSFVASSSRALIFAVKVHSEHTIATVWAPCMRAGWDASSSCSRPLIVWNTRWMLPATSDSSWTTCVRTSHVNWTIWRLRTSVYRPTTTSYGTTETTWTTRKTTWWRSRKDWAETATDGWLSRDVCHRFVVATLTATVASRHEYWCVQCWNCREVGWEGVRLNPLRVHVYKRSVLSENRC